MKLLKFDRNPVIKTQFDKVVKSYLDKKLKPLNIQPFMASDFKAVKDALENLAASEKPEQSGLSDRSEMLLDKIPAVSNSNVFQNEGQTQVSDYEKFRFISTVNIVSDPDIIIDKMATNILSYRDIDILKEWNSEYYEGLSEAVIRIISDYVAKNPDKRLPVDVLMTAGKITGVNHFEKESIQDMQAGFEEKTEEQPEQAVQPGIDLTAGTIETEPV